MENTEKKKKKKKGWELKCVYAKDWMWSLLYVFDFIEQD